VTARPHAKLAPSAAHRWINCPGSIRLSEGIEEKSSVFADEGTAAHELAEWCLSSFKDPATRFGDFITVNGCDFEIDEEMVDSVQLYVETVKSLVEPGDEVEYEAKLDLRHIPGMGFGTGDATIFKPKKRRLVIVDLKYGRGVPVFAKDNPQLRLYAVGLAQRYHNRGIDWIECIIVQPRCSQIGDIVPGVRKPDLIEAVDLVEFRVEVERAAAATMAPDAPLNPGDWCRFCPAAPTCPALRERVLAVAEMEFGEPPKVDSLTLDKMAFVLREAGIVKDWLKRVEERAHQMARDGNPPTGFKLVASRATRKWKDEAATVTYLGDILDLTEDQIYVEPKVRSPAQIERIIGVKRKGEIIGLVVSKSSGTILVSQEDPRPPVKVDAEEEFENA
jgi:hypothetical protein